MTIISFVFLFHAIQVGGMRKHARPRISDMEAPVLKCVRLLQTHVSLAVSRILEASNTKNKLRQYAFNTFNLYMQMTA